VLALSVLALLLAAPPSALAQTPESAPEPPDAAPSKGWLGVWLGDAVDGGIEVVAVVPGGPSHQAGVRVGDVLLQAQDIDLTEQEKLRGVLTATRPGETIRLVVLRGGRPVETVITTGTRPEPPAPPGARSAESPPAAASAPAPPAVVTPGRGFRVSVAGLESRIASGVLGLSLSGVTPQLRQHYGAPADAGVLVTGVEEGKPGDVAGFEVGDVLVTLDGRKIVRPEQLESALLTWADTRPLSATVVRGREPLRIEVATSSTSPDPGPVQVRTQLDRARREWETSQRVAERDRLRLEIRQLERRLESLRRRLASIDANGQDGRGGQGGETE
jgi:hypothetical protein